MEGKRLNGRNLLIYSDLAVFFLNDDHDPEDEMKDDQSPDGPTTLSRSREVGG